MLETEIIARVKNKSGSGSRSQLSLTSSIIAENPHKSNRFEENRGGWDRDGGMLSSVQIRIMADSYIRELIY